MGLASSVALVIFSALIEVLAFFRCEALKNHVEDGDERRGEVRV